jgi:hypothetical protein
MKKAKRSKKQRIHYGHKNFRDTELACTLPPDASIEPQHAAIREE